MNLARLLTLVPLIIAVSWLGYLIFKQNLASKTLGAIVSYFLGVVIIFLAVGFLIDSFFLPWVNARVQNAESSMELQEFTDTVNTIFEESLANPTPTLVPQPTPVIINILPEENGDGGGSPVIVVPESSGGTTTQPRTYVVQRGDNLTLIAQRFNTTVQALLTANNLTTDRIFEGQSLVIPPATSP